MVTGVGIAVFANERFVLLTGNHVGVLLADYLLPAASVKSVSQPKNSKNNCFYPIWLKAVGQKIRCGNNGDINRF